MDANSGEPWSEMDISDLTNEIAHGRTMAETASFLCRDETRCAGRTRSCGWSNARQARQLEQMAEQGDQQDHHHRDPHAGEGNGAALLNAGHYRPPLS